MIETYPVTPETVTVLGYRVRATKPMWTGLDFSRAELRSHASIMLLMCGEDAPLDLHLSVPWKHPDDPPDEDDDCWYRVRPRAEVGKRWRGRLVKSVVIVAAPALDPPWAIEIGYAA
jgi:hypothetical protein